MGCYCHSCRQRERPPHYTFVGLGEKQRCCIRTGIRCFGRIHRHQCSCVHNSVSYLLNGSKQGGQIICIRVMAVSAALGELSGAAFQSAGPGESRSRVVGTVNVVMVAS